jgi:hypothetical protein
MGYQQFTRLFTTPYAIYMEVPDHCERLLGRVLVVSQFLRIIFFLWSYGLLDRVSTCCGIIVAPSVPRPHIQS